VFKVKENGRGQEGIQEAKNSVVPGMASKQKDDTVNVSAVPSFLVFRRAFFNTPLLGVLLL
jgi:hypothetical protein